MNDRLMIKVKGSSRKEVATMMQKIYDSIRFMNLIFSASNIELQRDGHTFIGTVSYRDAS